MSEEIDRWILFMKENPDTWKKVHTEFINAQFDKAERFWKELLKQPNGKQKLIDAYGIKNLKGYEGLLK
ncbi:MAG TPA: hypothetical protein HA362_05330 [Nanoarchaeota archaeon]|nr:hypothetical protein [Nanoarchaeota archaeon]